MRTRLTTLAMVAAVGGLSLPVSASAGDRGSMEDQMACTPDVYRLCSNFVPDEGAITACLKQKLSALSPGCQRVFTRPDSPAAKDESDD